jgi:hypothetical protein
MQIMELDRITEMEKFIQTYNNAIQILCETMNQVNYLIDRIIYLFFFRKVKQDLYSIRITPQDDITTEAKLNVQTTETEILLYDIYVCKV